MNYTDPIEPTISEPCTQQTVIDQTSAYIPPPATGNPLDPLTPGEPKVVEDQSPYPSPLTYADLPHSSMTEWRLVVPLREVAAKPGTDFKNPIDPSHPNPGWDDRTPLDTLKTAAGALAASGGQLEAQHKIRAKADLAVTGRLAFETLAKMGFTTPQDVVAAMNLGPTFSAAALQVVQRAQKVAWAIRGNPSWRATLRPQLGWIGVSGEDDAPHRPCNVFSLPAPQYDIQVEVGGRKYTTRITIVESPYPTPVSKVADNPPTFLPPDDVPTVSTDSDFIMLYMPGDASRLEEAADLIPTLLAEAARRGKKISILSFDLVGWGYSARRVIDSSGQAVLFDQSLFPTVSYPNNPPALQFVEDFVVALLQTLNQQAPFVDLNKVVPIGGSLGGNLALRLGRRSDLPWLHAVCGWSAASVWPSKAANPDAGTLAGDGAAAGAGVGAGIGGIFGPIGAVVGAIVGAVAGAVVGAVGGAYIDEQTVSQCTAKMNALEDSTQRGKHFADVFDNDTVTGLVPPQAKMWYRDDWEPCKDIAMSKDRLDRREVYDQIFRRWHWRISQDQLVYSHRDPDPDTGLPRYMLNTIPMLLAAGREDDYAVLNIQYAAIYSWTRDLASKIPAPGTSLFLNHTGHSIHNERPTQLALAIFDFLDAFWKITVPSADCASGGPYPAQDLGTYDGNGTVVEEFAGDVTIEKIDNGFQLTLTSHHGGITIHKKIDQHSHAYLTACSTVQIGEKVDQGSIAYITTQGNVIIGQKIDQGSFAKITSLGGSIDIGQKVDQSSTAILIAGTTVHIGEKIDQHSHVQIIAQGDVIINQGIDQEATADITSVNGSIIIEQAVDGKANATLRAPKGSVRIDQKVAGGASVKWHALSFTCPDISGGSVTQI